MLSRRNFGAVAVAGTATATLAKTSFAQTEIAQVAARQGRLKQSVCRWCFGKMSLELLCEKAVQLGLVGIDLLTPSDFVTLKKYNLVCTMVSTHSLADGLCDPKFHDAALSKIVDAIEATSAAGFRNVICFSGNARGIDRKTGMKNCVEALRKVVGVAEKKNVILNMELLNSRVDHPDYLCDRSDWGVELVKQVGSNHFKLLFDIYHMQIMEGDIIRTIQRHHKYFGHYHTAGNPGRHELNDQQELRYPPIARAIADAGFDGFLAHEFIPLGDPVAGLRDAVEQCVV
ncbi:MAG: TIM barrel protein [Planctomycetes bacterium]|nr:TIM barrel protein [Planctomycetota bacterium]